MAQESDVFADKSKRFPLRRFSFIGIDFKVWRKNEHEEIKGYCCSEDDVYVVYIRPELDVFRNLWFVSKIETHSGNKGFEGLALFRYLASRSGAIWSGRFYCGHALGCHYCNDYCCTFKHTDIHISFRIFTQKDAGNGKAGD